MLRLAVLSILVAVVLGHGALYEPPGRSSMWRFGFKNPVNYNDGELHCGGISRHWQINGGKCGICGDPWDAPEPRANEDGGKFGNGIVVRTYKAGEVFTAEVNIIANHKGYFEFKLCPVKKGQKVDQDCLDKNPIALADGTGLRYRAAGKGKGIVKIPLRMPYHIKCDRCVLQWHYKAENHWGVCEDGVGRDGCGPQEFFRACADIRVE